MFVVLDNKYCLNKQTNIVVAVVTIIVTICRPAVAQCQPENTCLLANVPLYLARP